MDDSPKRRWYSIRPLVAQWFHLAFLIIYVVEVAVRHRDFETWLARLGFSDRRAIWLLVAVPVLLYGAIYWSRRRRETHQSLSAPNNRWRGP
jgi:hypothetical protein